MSEKKTESFFDKTVFGGYDPEQVDEFVGEARKLLANFKKENEILKQKLQVLAETVETYREAEAQAAAKAAESPAAPVSESAPSDAAAAAESASPEAVEICQQQVDALNQQIMDLTAQIDMEQARLAALRKERLDFAQTLAEQYESKLRELRDERTTDAIEPAQSAAVAVSAENGSESQADSSAASQPADPAPASDQPDASCTSAAPEPSAVAETAAVAAIETNTAISSETPSSAAQAPQAAAAQPVQQTAVAEQTKPDDTPVPQVEAGDSVYLNAGGVDTSNLSYEEALALVLKKNGILQQTAAEPTPTVDKSSTDSQATKIIPRIPSMQTEEDLSVSRSAKAAKAAKSDKPKKKGLFRSLKNSIHSFLEEDDDDDDLMPIPDQKNSEELQFGKAYNVKKDR